MTTSTPPSRSPRLIASEVAEQLRCNALTARRLMASGEIESVKVAERWTTTQDAIDAYLTAQTTTAKATRRRRARRAS